MAIIMMVGCGAKEKKGFIRDEDLMTVEITSENYTCSCGYFYTEFKRQLCPHFWTTG